MSRNRKNQYKNQRVDFAIQSDPIDYLQIEQKVNRNTQNNTNNNLTSKQNTLKQQIANDDKKIKEYSEKQDRNNNNYSKMAPFRSRKNSTNKNLKLQDNTIHLDKNVYEVVVGQQTPQSSYILSLQQELQTLREKIRQLESEQKDKDYKKTIGYDNRNSNFLKSSYNQSKSKTIETRRSLCGRIYNRGQTPNNVEKSARYSNKNQESSYYKWKPSVNSNESSDVQSFSKQIADQRNKKQEQNLKSFSNYRIKSGKKLQKDIKKLNQKNLSKKNPQNQDYQMQKIQSKMQKVKQSQQLKKVFVQNQQWQINSINDDFREKIVKKLQIPKGFPLPIPKITDNLQQYEAISEQIYALFNIDIKKCRDKLIIRRFKNGVYFELKPNKNIVWYFNGAFYFGDWQTALPSEGQKNGFGFQYIPGKYYYLGEFKNGMRNGKGSIKVIGADAVNFTAYDGNWIEGKPHGSGKHIDLKSNKYIGNFQKSQKTGSAIMLSRDGLYYDGQVKNGLKHGYGVQKLINGDTYIGQFFEGKFEGRGIYKWKNGSVYQGEFLRGIRQGRGKWNSYNGDTFEGQYSNDVKNGWGKFVWANGQIYQGQFKNDLRHGEGTYKHPSGKMGKFMWIQGQIDHRLYTKQQQTYRCRLSAKRQSNNDNLS